MNMVFKFSIYFLMITTFVAECRTDSRPNVVIFMADDLGWNDVGFHGSDHLRTPNIDALAADGIRLNRHYTQPLCTPSRGALMSGIHPIHSGTQNAVLRSASPWGFPLDQKMLPQYLKELGYSTHAVGKWHLGFYREEHIPTHRGFDSHNGYWNGGEDYYTHLMTDSKNFSIGYDFRLNREVDRNASNVYSTEHFTDRCLHVITEHNNSNPLFLYMAYQSVRSGNSPYTVRAPTELMNKFSYIPDPHRRAFAAAVYAMDESIGRIVEHLSDKQLLDNTIILFLSDNGAATFCFYQNSGSNYPLRGSKGTPWEGGVRVPAFVWSPLLKRSGVVFNSSVRVMDWLPTLLEAIDSKAVETRINGTSLWKALNGEQSLANRELLLNIDPINNMSAIIADEWKLIQGSLPNPPENPNLWSKSFALNRSAELTAEEIANERLNSSAYKVLSKMKRKFDFNSFNESVIECPTSAGTACHVKEELCLFHIRSDPCEQNNLANTYPNVTQVLWQRIKDYNKTAIKPLNKPLDPKADPKLHGGVWEVWVH